MLKFKLDAAAYAALSADLQAMYEQKGDGFTLKVDGLPQAEDVTGLKAKVEELLNEKKAERPHANRPKQPSGSLMKNQHARLATFRRLN